MQRSLILFMAMLVCSISSVSVAADGEALYKRLCFACHDTGAGESPKLTEKDKWAPRIAKGEAALLETVIAGKNAMLPRAGCADCSDDDLRAGIAYIVDKVK